ncbi:MAG: hypothetical protein FJW30_11615 [Acidobacteria bacterium]|nr:hypothetical protein [Acidobacteriota bacterium]
MALADQLACAGYTGAAYLICLRILQADPANLDVRERIGVLLTTEGRFDEALAELRCVADARPRPGTFYNLAAANLAACQWSDARLWLERCLGADPAHAEGCAAYPWALLECGEIEAAKSAALSALERLPDSALLRRTLARLQTEQGLE